jgi:hypothetical protein
LLGHKNRLSRGIGLSQHALAVAEARFICIAKVKGRVEKLEERIAKNGRQISIQPA